MVSHIPVITVDGPSGVGKGTLSQKIATYLGWHWLDSGALYRVLAYAAEKRKLGFTESPALIALAKKLPVEFIAAKPGDSAKVLLEGEDVSEAIRSEACGQGASTVGAIESVRSALLQRQRDFRELPGLVTDGRDMGTVVFPEADVKFFLKADSHERAKRRFLQLQEKGKNASLSRIISEMEIRDKRDSERNVAPLKPADDAIILDTSYLSIDEVFEEATAVVAEKLGIVANT